MERVQEHSAMLHHLGAMMDRVVQTMNHWERQEVSPVPPQCLDQSPPVPSGANSVGMLLSLPREYDGTAAQCQGFLLQLDLYLATVHPAPSGGERVAALISCLTGRALEWENAFVERRRHGSRPLRGFHPSLQGRLRPSTRGQSGGGEALPFEERPGLRP